MKVRLIAVFILCGIIITYSACGSDDTEALTGPVKPSRQDFDGIYYAYPDSADTAQSRQPAFYFFGADELPGWDMEYHFLITDIYQGRVLADTIESGVTGIFRYDYPGTLDPNTSYIWSVTVHDSNQYDYTRYEWSFTTGDGFNNPPFKPFDPEPEADADSVRSDQFMLHWDCLDPDGDDMTYDVWIKRNGSQMGWIQYGFGISEDLFRSRGPSMPALRSTGRSSHTMGMGVRLPETNGSLLHCHDPQRITVARPGASAGSGRY